MNWYLGVLKKYAVFSGRARRAEYWYFVLFNALFSIALTIVDFVVGTYSAETGLGLFSGLYGLAMVIPSIAVTVRRLHDTDRSGWWLLIPWIPGFITVGGALLAAIIELIGIVTMVVGVIAVIIAVIVLLVFMVQDSQPEENWYGPNPKAAPA